MVYKKHNFYYRVIIKKFSGLFHLLTKQEVWLITAEAVIFVWPTTAMTEFVTLLALSFLIHVRVQRAITEPHTVSASIFTPVGVTAEAG